MTIGLLARECGIKASAIRYYERLGLLPLPARRSGRRVYGGNAADRVAVIQLARECGCSIAETKQLIRGLGKTVEPPARWRALAAVRLAAIDEQIARLEAMKDMIRKAAQCGCPTMEECGAIARRLRTSTPGRASGTDADCPAPDSSARRPAACR